MKHSIRQRIINEYGLPVVKIMQIDGELGSSFKDRNGNEIFEGDIVHNCFNAAVVVFENGSFWLNGSDLYSYVREDIELEIVGHIAEEQQ